MSSNYDGLTRNPWPGTWSSNGTHPIVLDTELRGSLQSISGTVGDQLTNITGQRLNEGMIVYVLTGYTAGAVTRSGDTYYKYNLLPGQSRNVNTGEMPNSEDNWTLVSFSGGGGGGTSGYSGYSGISGYSGVDGLSGFSGESGYSGFSGVDGLSGYSGESGTSGFSGEIGFSGYSGFSGQAFSGDYVAEIQAGTGVSISGTSGSGGVPIVSIGQPVAITDSVVFGNLTIASGGKLLFEDDIAKALAAGATVPYDQISAASKFYTNADALAGLSLSDLKPGDFYYDDVNAAIYICIDTGLGYFDFLDLTVRASL